MKDSKLTIFALTAGLLTTTTPLMADEHDESSFDEAELFFELNNTDGDLGIHGKIDGDEWKLLKIEDPNGRLMLKARVMGRLKRQGLTEIFFESAEPTFDELAPEDFFKRFPEGVYEIEGVTLDKEERENEVLLSHVIPAAPANIMINMTAASSDCDISVPSVNAPVTLSWDAVTASHADLGKSGDIDVRYYEIVVEIDDTDFKSTSIIPGNITEWTLPADFTALAAEGQYKFEILVRAENGNKTATEGCFEVE